MAKLTEAHIANVLRALIDDIRTAWGSDDPHAALDKLMDAAEESSKTLRAYDSLLLREAEDTYERAVEALDALGCRPSEVCRTIDDCVRQMEALSQEHGYGRG